MAVDINSKMDLMTKEESYAERRQLFKNIWDTAMNIDEKDAEIMNKPKVIKTLRLGEVDKCIVGRKKKQRIKNLRTVCNKILDFCDRQDADDVFYEQLAAESQLREPPHHKTETTTKKVKVNKIKKKLKAAKSLFSPHNEYAQARATTSERKDDFMKNAVTKTSRNTSPIKFKKTTILRSSDMTNKTVKSKASPRAVGSKRTNVLGDTNATGHRRKTARRKHIKKKKPTDSQPPGILEWPEL